MPSTWADCERAMTTSGAGIFYDGVTSARHAVTVELAPAALRISAADGEILAEWPYDEIETLSAPEGVLRIGRARNPVLARLEVRDPALAAAIDDLSIPVDRSGRSEQRMRRKVVFWSLAATASLVIVAVFGVPAIATRLAPLVPYRVELLLGRAVDAQIRKLLDTSNAGAAFECGQADGEGAGRIAFEQLIGKLEAAASLPIPLSAAVVRKSDANAIALPGGRIYVFQGLIDKSETPDELAGVLAHEIGHVARRDGTRSVLQAAGLSFLFGMLLGDFVGGGAVVVVAKTILQSSYSREVEAAADTYSVDLMIRVRGDPHALAAILKRIAGKADGWSKLLLDHPETKVRIAAIEAAPRGTPQSLLAPAQWAELKRICSQARNG
jgi:Zn-dependent protease with chaperone function